MPAIESIIEPLMTEKITSAGPVTVDSIAAEQLSPHRAEQTTTEKTTTINAESSQLIEQTAAAQSTSPLVALYHKEVHRQSPFCCVHH